MEYGITIPRMDIAGQPADRAGRHESEFFIYLIAWIAPGVFCLD